MCIMLTEDLHESVDIKVNFNNEETPEEKIAALEGLAADRSKFRKLVMEIMTAK